MSALGSLPDEELVIRAQEGSEEHFSALVDRYASSVYRLAYSITSDAREAEEVVQETFLRAFKHLDRYSLSKGGFKTWVMAIARNQSINVFKSLRRRAARFLDDTFPEDLNPGTADAFFTRHEDAETQLSNKQQHARLEKALTLLPERQRTALLLRTQEQMSYEEIASLMSVSVSSVESLIFRARKRLLEVMENV